MTMETNVSYTVAGTFILVLLSFIVFAVIWLSAGFSSKDYSYYTVYMKESISGLSKEGPVEFNGVNVGSIEDMKIDRENPQIVILTLKVETDTPVTMGTRAKLGMRALTGVAYLLLEDKGNDKRPLALKEGQKYPVIATVPSILVRLETALTQINDSFKTVSTSIGTLLNKDNLNNVKDILRSGKGSMQTLEVRTLPQADDALSNFSDMARGINSFTSELKENPSMLIRGSDEPVNLGPGER